MMVNRIHIIKIKRIRKCFLAGLLWFVFSGYFSAFAQTREFDSIFNKVATDFSHTNPEKAHHIADSLHRNSSTPLQEVRSLMLKANVYYNQTDLKNALQLARRAEKIARKTKNVDWQIRIRGFYSNIYRDLNFIKEGLSELEKIDKLLDKIEPGSNRDRLYLLNHQAKAYFYSYENQHDSVLYHLSRGDEVYQSVSKLNDGGYHIAVSEEIKARAYFFKNELHLSYEAYHAALEALEPYENSSFPVYGYIYAGLGSLAHYKDKDSACAEEYFAKAEALITDAQNPGMSYFVVERLREFYSDHNDSRKLRHYTAQRDSLRVNLNNERQILVADFYGEAKTSADKSQVKLKHFYNVLAVLSLVLVFFSFRLFKIKINKYDETALVLEDTNDAVLVEEDLDKIAKLCIAEETEKAILEKLLEFEEEKLYLDTDVNMAVVATFCKTNSRYISEVIKKYKDADFHSYINRLRIEYIVKKLREDEKYRNYKISYLAKEACFSSHSKFSAMFKEVKGVSPSVFIRQIRKNQPK